MSLDKNNGFKTVNEINSTHSSSRYVDYPPFFYDNNRHGEENEQINVTILEQEEDIWNSKKFTLSTRTAGFQQNPVIDRFTQFFSNSLFEVFDLKNQNKKTRLVENRAYTKLPIFQDAYTIEPPMLKDLSPPQTKSADTVWIGLPIRILSFIGPYLLFPYLVRFADYFLGSDSTILDNITAAFGPGVSILYGTFVSLTLSIAYKRQQDIQDKVATESALLTSTFRNMLALFKEDRMLAIELGQATADQIRTLAKSSRGEELMMLMYNDPYARFLELLQRKEDDLIKSSNPISGSFSHCRDTIRELYQTRSTRLSKEALALPPTHFSILTSLTILILTGYTIHVLPTVSETAAGVIPPNDSSIVFGLLCSIYVLFYNFANDLNDPFGGIYQVRRSATASHLLQIKWLLVNHPLIRGEVDFSNVEVDEDEDILIRSPALNEMWFQKQKDDS